MNATLRSLLAGFCDYVQAADRDQIISTGNLLFDGVAFTVKSREQGQRREMLIYCDFGEAAPEEATRRAGGCSRPICSCTTARRPARFP